MSINLGGKVSDYLKKNPDQKYTARELAQWFFATYPEVCKKKKDRSSVIDTDEDLITQISSEIGALIHVPNKNNNIKRTEDRPKKYYWANEFDDRDVEETEIESANISPPSEKTFSDEKDLYPIVSKYLYGEGIYPKRINERKSSNTRGRRGNHWLHPDLVGMEDLTARWEREIKDTVKEYAVKKIRLWSFEVKQDLDKGGVHLREAFFQAVSNSSWANLGYLAAVDIDKKEETMDELRMLSSLHGIGVIQIDPDDPAESRILIHARERPEIDWATCNRIAKANKDFLQFVKLVRKFHQTGDPHPKEWDIPADEG